MQLPKYEPRPPFSSDRAGPSQSWTLADDSACSPVTGEYSRSIARPRRCEAECQNTPAPSGESNWGDGTDEPTSR